MSSFDLAVSMPRATSRWWVMVGDGGSVAPPRRREFWVLWFDWGRQALLGTQDTRQGWGCEMQGARFLGVRLGCGLWKNSRYSASYLRPVLQLLR